MRIDPLTQVCALIGDPVSHSLSPAIHNAAFSALNLNFIYIAFRALDCAGALTGFRAFEQMKGMSVTIPHKISVCSHLDWIEDVAEKTGSVNTVVKDGGMVKGYNTDGPGALRALMESGVGVDKKSVLIFGSGGVARGIAFSMLMEEKPPSELTIIGIEKAQMDGLVEGLRALKRADVKGEGLTKAVMEKEMAKAGLLINCSPVGMWPDIEKTPIPREFLHAGLPVFDVVYNPLETRLLRDARALGCKTIDGLSMFLYQAVGQFELWTGMGAPIDVMREKAVSLLRAR